MSVVLTNMEEPMVIGKVLRKRFQLSSLSPEEKQRLGSYIKQLGGTYLDKQVCYKDLNKAEVLKFKVKNTWQSFVAPDQVRSSM